VNQSTSQAASARRHRRFLALLAALATAIGGPLLGGTARAQQTTFYLDRLQVSGDPDDGLVVWRPYLPEKTRFYAALALGYTLNPLHAGAITDNQNIQDQISNPVENQLIGHLEAGGEFSGRFAVGISLPITIAQGGGSDPARFGVGNGLDRTAPVVDDLRLNGRVKVYQSDNGKLQLGVGAAIWLPTGNAVSFAGDDQVTAHIYGSAEYNFGDFFVAGQIGPHFRPNRGIFGTEGALDVGSELRWDGGIFVPLRQGDVRLGGSLWGTTGIQTGEHTGQSTFFNGKNTDIEWLGEVRVLFDKKDRLYFSGGGGTRLSSGYGAPDLRLIAMLGWYGTLLDFGPGQVAKHYRPPPDVEMHDKDTDGDGYPDDIDLCPTEKEDGKPPDPTDGCPAPKDRDGDGIPDDADKCPDQPEDKDGIQDSDGCPETDADGDGIPDTEDACPLLPGDKSPDPKKNGCKIHKQIVETDSGIQLLDPIQFDTGRSTIKPVSFSILDEVVDVLKSRPEVRMGVYGNTDSKGAHDMNVRLSKDRAAAVVRYLVSKGIAQNRLESDGFGPDKPIDTNDTDEGRAKNRRVEFKVMQ